MSRRPCSFTRSCFDGAGDEPINPMASRVDIMLVFTCGLIAAASRTTSSSMAKSIAFPSPAAEPAR